MKLANIGIDLEDNLIVVHSPFEHHVGQSAMELCTTHRVLKHSLLTSQASRYCEHISELIIKVLE